MRDLSTSALAVLAVFAERPRHAYEVYCVMRDRDEMATVRLNAGSLYRAVQRMADDGLLTPLGTDRAGNRPERTTYEITAAGRNRLRAQVAQMLSTRAEEYPQFPVAVAESHVLASHDVATRLKERMDCLDADLAALASRADALDASALPARYWLDLRLRECMLRAEREWCAATTHDLTAGRLDGASTPCADDTSAGELRPIPTSNGH